MKKKFIISLFVILIILALPISVFAHSGRTDSDGGHKDNNNKSGLGSYHYHHGYGPHLHTNGICPYSPKDTISISNAPSSMKIGDSVDLSWDITYYSGSSTVSWDSSDSSVISVSTSGLLKAEGVGTAIITATMLNGEYSFNVSVYPVLVESITLTGIVERIEIDTELNIGAMIAPSNATDKSLIWASSNESIATIDSNGNIKALASGNTIISVYAVGGIRETFPLEVYEILTEKIQIDKDNYNIPIGSEVSFPVSIIPLDASRSDYKVTSTNEDIITYASDKLIAKAIGHAEIIITCQGLKKVISIEVYEIPAEKINIYPMTLSLEMNTTYQLSATIMAANTTDKTLVWTSSDPNIVSVDQTGFVSSLAPGEAVIFLECQGLIAEVPIEVSIIEIEKIEIDLSEIQNLMIGDSVTPLIHITPTDATYQEFELISSDQNILAIENKSITAVGNGKATLSVRILETGKIENFDIQVKSSSNVYIVVMIILLGSGCIILIRKRNTPKQ